MRRLRQLALENDEKGDLKPIEIKLSATAADRVFEFRKQCFSDGKTVTGYMAGVVGKAPGTVLRLALALELLWWADTTAPEPTTISERAIDAAIKLYDLYFAPMARRVFGEAALPSHIRHGVALARFIMQRKCETVNSRDINRNSGIPGFKEIDVVKLAIQSLEEAGWLIPAPNRDGKRPGRQKSDWLVNPRIWEREHD